MVITNLKLEQIKTFFAANCPQKIFTSELKFLVAKKFVPKFWAPNEVVGVLANSVAKNFDFHFVYLRAFFCGANATQVK
jgi:predicted nucleotide-binding protein (sugar kinase/HSP70/actin superfamily)